MNQLFSIDRQRDIINTMNDIWVDYHFVFHNSGAITVTYPKNDRVESHPNFDSFLRMWAPDIIRDHEYYDIEYLAPEEAKIVMNYIDD